MRRDKKEIMLVWANEINYGMPQVIQQKLSEQEHGRMRTLEFGEY